MPSARGLIVGEPGPEYRRVPSASIPLQRNVNVQSILRVVPPPSRQPLQPAGISARIHKLAATEEQRNFDSRVVDPLFRAVDIFKDKCAICWMLRREGWHLHISDRCTSGCGTYRDDPQFKAFRDAPFTLETGWCFSCLIHQVGSLFYLFYLIR